MLSTAVAHLVVPSVEQRRFSTKGVQRHRPLRLRRHDVVEWVVAVRHFVVDGLPTPCEGYFWRLSVASDDEVLCRVFTSAGDLSEANSDAGGRESTSKRCWMKWQCRRREVNVLPRSALMMCLKHARARATWNGAFDINPLPGFYTWLVCLDCLSVGGLRSTTRPVDDIVVAC